MYWTEKNRKCEIELRFWKIDFEYSVLKRVSIFRASFNIPTAHPYFVMKAPEFVRQMSQILVILVMKVGAVFEKGQIV